MRSSLLRDSRIGLSLLGCFKHVRQCSSMLKACGGALITNATVATAAERLCVGTARWVSTPSAACVSIAMHFCKPDQQTLSMDARHKNGVRRLQKGTQLDKSRDGRTHMSMIPSKAATLSSRAIPHANSLANLVPSFASSAGCSAIS